MYRHRTCSNLFHLAILAVIAKHLPDDADKYVLSMLTVRPYLPTMPQPRVWFIFRDSPPAPTVIEYLAADRLFVMRTWITEFDMPSDTLSMSMHLKAQSRIFPFTIFDGCAPLMQFLLGKGDEVWKEWRASLWYTAALADGVIQPGIIGVDSIVSSGDGLTSSLLKLGAYLFIVPKIKYGLKL